MSGGPWRHRLYCLDRLFAAENLIAANFLRPAPNVPAPCGTLAVAARHQQADVARVQLRFNSYSASTASASACVMASASARTGGVTRRLIHDFARAAPGASASEERNQTDDSSSQITTPGTGASGFR